MICLSSDVIHFNFPGIRCQLVPTDDGFSLVPIRQKMSSYLFTPKTPYRLTKPFYHEAYIKNLTKSASINPLELAGYLFPICLWVWFIEDIVVTVSTPNCTESNLQSIFFFEISFSTLTFDKNSFEQHSVFFRHKFYLIIVNTSYTSVPVSFLQNSDPNFGGLSGYKITKLPGAIGL